MVLSIINIINKSAKSYYNDTATTIYKDIGSHKVKTSMVLINRCENFQVIFLKLFNKT